jgi:hypothetical protein
VTRLFVHLFDGGGANDLGLIPGSLLSLLFLRGRLSLDTPEGSEFIVTFPSSTEVGFGELIGVHV